MIFNYSRLKSEGRNGYIGVFGSSVKEFRKLSLNISATAALSLVKDPFKSRRIGAATSLLVACYLKIFFVFLSLAKFSS